MFRLAVLALTVVLLAACSDCKSPCTSGVTFYVADVAGALSAGNSESLTICFDGDCKEATVTRANAGGTVFMPFGGISKGGDHTITVTGTGSLKGDYTGPLTTFVQSPGGGCSSCRLGAVKIGADGTLTPGTAVVPSTTTPAPATTGG